MRILITFLLIFTTAVAQQSNQDIQPPGLTVLKIQGEIKIDGDLSDPGWHNAAFTNDFTQYSPVDHVKPGVETEVYITYDDEYLYMGFLCHDDPSTIRATLSDRDGMFSDDFIGIRPKKLEIKDLQEVLSSVEMIKPTQRQTSIYDNKTIWEYFTFLLNSRNRWYTENDIKNAIKLFPQFSKRWY